MSEKYKKTRKYIEPLLILFSTVTGWVSISAFASLVYFRIGIMSPAVGISISAIAAGIKKYKSMIKKKKKRKNMIK